MAYQFDFLPVVENTDLLLRGALFTLELTAIGALLDIPNIRDIRLASKGLMGIPQHFLQDDVRTGLGAMATKARSRGVDIALHTASSWSARKLWTHAIRRPGSTMRLQSRPRTGRLRRCKTCNKPSN